VLQTVSPISSKSPSVRTIQSVCVLLQFLLLPGSKNRLLNLLLQFERSALLIIPVTFLLKLFLLFSMLGIRCFNLYYGLFCSTLFIDSCLSSNCFSNKLFLLLIHQLPHYYLCYFFPFLCSYCLHGRALSAFVGTYTKICGFFPLY